MADGKTIDRATFRQSVTSGVTALHITGGVRAIERPGRLWSWYPVIAEGHVRALDPQPIQVIDDIARRVGLELFGGDEQVGFETALVTRIWTPLKGAGDGTLQPANQWQAIARAADGAGDKSYSLLAAHIAYSLSSAGIRLRDASDGYNSQLDAAIDRKDKSPARFSNMQMQDIELAFHSVLSELASARDYLAASLALKLGAPARIDALNRLVDWLDADSRKDLRDRPIVKDLLKAYDSSSDNPWIYLLTEYRNLFLHRQPLGSTAKPQFLRYETVELNGISFPRIVLPLNDADPSAPGQDALTRFISLYREMTNLLKLAAEHAPYAPIIDEYTVV